MSLNLSPFQELGVVAITPLQPGRALPRHVRVVDEAVAVEVRRLALDPVIADRFAAVEPVAARSGAGSGAGDETARLDALIALAEHTSDPGRPDRGGS